MPASRKMSSPRAAPIELSNVETIETSEKYKQVISSDGPLVIEFTAPWESPCKALSPKFDAYSRKFSGKAHFYRVDICESQDVAMDSGVKTGPQYHFYKSGSKVDQYVGAEYPALERNLAKWIS